ncbi:MAG: MerR family transcriptional regulator [Peptostreptococcaceae bacterium]|nr:MerR family transcriptional regulator [Peptostreptococcaceae bacterium]
MEYYSIGRTAKEIGKTMATLRNWDNKGILKPDYVTDGGTRFYSENLVNYLLGLKARRILNIKTLNEEKYDPEKKYCKISDINCISIKIDKDIQARLMKGLAERNMTLQDYISWLLIKDGMVEIHEGKYI